MVSGPGSRVLDVCGLVTSLGFVGLRIGVRPVGIRCGSMRVSASLVCTLRGTLIITLGARGDRKPSGLVRGNLAWWLEGMKKYVVGASGFFVALPGCVCSAFGMLDGSLWTACSYIADAGSL
jgi:hypothetical protein